MNLGSLNGFTLNGSPLDAYIRETIVGYAYAIAAPLQRIHTRMQTEARADGVVIGRFIVDGAHHLIVDAKVYANATYTVRVGKRESKTLAVYANAAPKITRFARSKLTADASALAVLVARSRPRRWISNPWYVTALATTSHTSRAKKHEAVSGAAEAQATPTPHRFTFMPATTVYAEAVGFIGGSVTIWAPFDEPAVPENTFIVPYEDHVFYVR